MRLKIHIANRKYDCVLVLDYYFVAWDFDCAPCYICWLVTESNESDLRFSDAELRKTHL